jgi:hypothetical protein
MQERRLEADVVIAGGGMAGVCAALAAARNGATVVLIQNRSVLGGNASSEIRMHICGADCSGGRPGWRESGIIEEIRLDDAVANPQRSASLFDLRLYDKVVSEPHITLLLDTDCCGVEMARKDRIVAVAARCDPTEDLFRIDAPIFCDCTGDGRLGLEAGADFRVGREAKSEYGEPLARDQTDKMTLGSTILFMTREHEGPRPFHPPAWIRKFSEHDLRKRSHTPFEYGFWWVEWGGQLDTIKDNREIRHELLRIALGVWDHIKNGGDHGADNWSLEWVGMLPCKRESRRFLGEHVLRQQDLEQAVLFDDRVAYGGWPMDLHPPDGVDQPDVPPCVQHRLDQPYSIPLRSLYSRNVANLVFAGRNISATHVAFGSSRVMATCSVIGQAVGTAAAYCARDRMLPRELARDTGALRRLQQTLLRDDQTILGLEAADEGDLMRTARLSASAEAPGCQAANVANGFARAVGDASNQWRGPLQDGEAFLEAAWAAPQYLSRVALTFDTGFDRPLTLTHSDRYNARMIRGPQPETVRDYELRVRTGATWSTVARVTENHQRRRVHEFSGVKADALQLVVRRTHGDPNARVFEMRAYA